MEIEDILENCKIIEEATTGIEGQVSLGSKVTVQIGEENSQTFTIVGSVEADPSQGKISHESPVGSQLIGLSQGDTVKVELPHSTLEYKVVEIHSNK